MLVRRSPMMLSRQTRQRLPEALDTGGAQGLLDDKVLFLVFKASNWNPFMICTGAMVCKRFAAMTKKVIWKEFCLSRAPKMVTHLISGGKDGNIPGGWEPLGRLMFNCPGCHASKHFISNVIPGHFVWKSKFSRSLGKDFLTPQCSADTLYISGSCEHLNNGDDDDLGLYRGIFRAFGRSSTCRILTENGVPMEEKERCPFCREKVHTPA